MPAIAGGITDRLWEVSDLVTLLEADERRLERAASAVALRCMGDVLQKIVYESGPLVSVAYLRFENDAHFITTVGLQFGLLSAVFRAVEADDTLAVTLGTLVSSEDETLVEATHSAPWSACLGLGLRW